MTSHESDSKVYNISQRLSSEHYENFPVASFLFPKDLRKAVSLIYTFARTADDIADEGDYASEERLISLNKYREAFLDAHKGNYQNTFWKLLHKTIISRNLNPIHFTKLLDAFEQDLFKKEYNSFDEVLAYCENSANPVGRIILELYEIRDEHVNILSDKICTALQLTNFWQDVKIDLKKNRVYIPLEDFEKFNIDKSLLFSEQSTKELRQIVKFEADRTIKLFVEGSEILRYLPFRLKFQIKWTINGGMKILHKIKKNNYDVLNFRPTLKKIDYIIALFQPVKKNVK
ncbi:MAG: squalene synthase HpnC [Melioribacteraceae bacterium]|nr:MAG: squalene synthase HpnC [Melioribacteraceae bacterium]